MRALATFGSFVLLMLLYFLYGWVAVPLLLPTRAETEVMTAVAAENVRSEEITPYLSLFPKNSWVHNPDQKFQYLRSGDTLLFFGEDVANGKMVKLEPCSVVMIPGMNGDNPSDAQFQQQLRQAVIMQTPDYAEIEFNKDFNLGQGAMPDIVGGRLFGAVKIESAGKKTGPEDDIYLETEDVALSMVSPALTTIKTVKDVRFRFGYHSGEGSMLSMELIASNPKQPKSAKELSRLQFETLKRLDLVFPENPNVAAKVLADKTPGALQGRRVLPGGAATLMNITCQRQFSFFSQKKDQSWIARFLGNVQISRTAPDGLTDLITGDDVLVDFQAKQGVTKTAATAGGLGGAMGDLEPVRFKALGRLAQNNQPPEPARLDTKRNGGVRMAGDQILYDMKKNTLALETQTGVGASPEVEIVLENRYTIRGQKGFEYLMAPGGEFGRLTSLGAGTLQGNFGEPTAPRNLFLSWKFMQVTPDPENKELMIVKLWDGIAAHQEGFGKMTAGKLDLWLRRTETAPASSPPPSNAASSRAMLSGENGLKPVVAVLSDKVHFENEQGTCDVNRMEITFASDGETNAVAMNHPAYMVQPWHRLPPRCPAVMPGWEQHSQQLAPLQNRYETRQIASDFSLNNHIRQVQHLQPLQQSVPLYEAQANQPTASQTRAMSGQTGAPAASKAPTSVATQNLLGLSASDSPVRYEITGNLMQLQVRSDELGNSIVDTIRIDGMVHMVETVLDTVSGPKKSELIEIQGDEVRVWNPSTPETQVLITGTPVRNAEFRGRGVRMVAQEINLSKPENKIWSNGKGQLVVDSDKTEGVMASRGFGPAQTNVAPATHAETLTPLKSQASVSTTSRSDSLTVDWNEVMLFDGQTIIFRGVPDPGGNRVHTLFQDKQIWCNKMEIQLNRLVNFFEKDDETNIPTETETIRCLNDVYILIQEKDENGQPKSTSVAQFETLAYQVKMNYFVASANGQGMLRRTFLSAGGGFGDSGALPGAVASRAEPKNTGKDTLSFLSVWFQRDVRGSLRPGLMDVELNGRVQAVYCPVESWDDKIGIENMKAARRLGHILECETLRIVQMPDPLNPNQGAMELSAKENAVIDGSKLYGKAREIRYNQAKSLVIFNGNARINTTDSNGKRMENSAEAFEYNLDTGAFKVIQTSGIGLGP